MKPCISPSCTNPRFSQKLCRFHWGREQLRSPKKKKIAFGRKAGGKLSVAKLKKELEVLYAPVVRMEAANDEGYAKCICCGLELYWRPETSENEDGRKVLSSRFLTNGHWISRRLAPSLVYRRWNTHPQCNDCNWKEPPSYTFFMVRTYGQEKVDWFWAQRNIPWKPTAFEVEVLIKEYVEKFLAQCARLKYIPSVKEQKVIDKYTTKNLETQVW